MNEKDIDLTPLPKGGEKYVLMLILKNRGVGFNDSTLLEKAKKYGNELKNEEQTTIDPKQAQADKLRKAWGEPRTPENEEKPIDGKQAQADKLREAWGKPRVPGTEEKL